MDQLRSKFDIVAKKLAEVLSSRYFFIFILVLAAVQGLWYALSFKPVIYDELRHFENILIYTHKISPFLTSQNPDWDVLGQVIRDGSYLYYYIMSWPLRFIQLFTGNQMVQIIFLRLIHTAFFIGSLVFFRKALSGIKSLPNYIVNLTLMFVVLTPAVGFLAGIINYDGLALFLFAITLWLSLKIIQSTKLRVDLLMLVVIFGSLMSLVKWTQAALFIPILAYLAYFIWRDYRGNFLVSLKLSWSKIDRLVKVLLVGGVIVSGLLVIERPIANQLIYGIPNPSCPSVIGEKRCQNFRDYTIYSQVKQNKSPDFKPESPPQFLIEKWLPRVSNTMTNLLEQGSKTSLPVMVVFYDTVILLGGIVFLLGLREVLAKGEPYKFLMIVAGVYIFIVAARAYDSYLTFGIPAGIRARYIAPVLPILISTTALSTAILFRRYKKALIIGLLGMLIIMTQGASGVTYLLTTPTNVQWESGPLEDFNGDARSFISEIVIE